MNQAPPAAGPPRPLALTMGEPAGIGAEITVKAWQARAEKAIPPFVYCGDPRLLEAAARILKVSLPLRIVTDPSNASAAFKTALPVSPVGLQDFDGFAFGRPNGANAAAVAAALDRAVDGCRAGRFAGVVTNPLNKAVMWAGGFEFPGHTEYLGNAFAGASPPAKPVMMLMNAELKVVPVTVHLPLAAVPAALSADLVCDTGTRVAAALASDFGLARPRLAVAALNPHAGEAGGLGREEVDIIEPAVQRLRASGIEASGPFAADSLFHAARRRSYDAVLCMYHDQALIPLKTIDFDTGVNVTLGLPIVRTSPDHGTALDIAGTGRAGAASLEAALQTAAAIAARRAQGQTARV